MEIFTANITAAINAAINNSAAFGGSATFPFTLPSFLSASFGNGPGNNNISALFTQQVLLAAGGTNSTLTLSNMSNLLDPLNLPITVDRIKGLFMQIQGNLGAIFTVSAGLGASGGGATYTVGDLIAVPLNGNTGSPAILKVQSTAASPGAVTSYSVVYPGSYNAAFSSQSNLAMVSHVAVLTATPTTAGSNYVIGDLVQIAGTGGTLVGGAQAQLRVTGVSGGGITTVAVVNGGVYSTAPTLTGGASTCKTSNGSGAIFTLTVSAASSGSGAFANLATNTVSSGTPPSFVETDFLTIGNAGSNPWKSIIPTGTALKTMRSGTNNAPGTWIELNGGSLGYPVTSGANEGLLIANNGVNPVAYNLVLLGSNG